MLWPKTNWYKEFGNEKNSCSSKIPFPHLPPPPPAHNFSNGPSHREHDDNAIQVKQDIP